MLWTVAVTFQGFDAVGSGVYGDELGRDVVSTLLAPWYSIVGASLPPI